MAVLAFLALAFLSVAGAVAAVTLKNLVHSVLSLILFFLGISGLFVMLHAPFLAAVQVLIYVGAVAVLMLFTIMLTRHVTGLEGVGDLGSRLWVGLAGGALVFAIVANAVRRVQWPAPHALADAKVVELGESLMQAWVVPFEVVSILLTAAMVGAIVLALEDPAKKKKAGPGAEATPKPAAREPAVAAH